MKEKITLCEDLTTKLGDRLLTKNVTLELHVGTVTVLVGPSGVGKSLLADIIFGFRPRAGADPIQITSGQVKTAAHDCALVFQAGGGLGHVTVDDNLRLVCSDVRRNAQLLAALGLSDPAQRADTLSGGELRRLATARAVASDRKVLWLDEPASGLDVVRATRLAEILRDEAGTRGRAILVTSHQPDFITQVADRLLFFARSGDIKEAEPPDLRANPHELRETIRTLIDLSADAVEEAGHQAGTQRERLSLQAFFLELWYGIGTFGRIVNRRSWETRATLRLAIRLALVEGALFYPIVGAIFAGVFIMLQKNILAAFPTWKILMEHGPALIGRVSPALAGILVAARAGAAISSWCGQLVVTRQFDALKLLSHHLDRRIAGAGWAGLFVAGITGTLSFAFGLFAIFALYLWMRGHAHAIPDMLGNFELRSVCAALFKVVIFSCVVAGASMASARQPKSAVESVATDLTRGIMLSTLLVMSLELLTLIAEWFT